MPVKTPQPPVNPPFPGAQLRTVNELERLEALRNYQILDTPPEQIFDDLVRLAAYICGTPASMVSMVDAERQWFKATIGMAESPPMPRELSVCQYAMLADDIVEIEDMRQSEFFKDNKLVNDELNIRFYAGAPLITPEGLPIGTICATDTVPHRLTEAQREALRILAREVVAHLELRRARLQLEQEQRKLDGLLRMANDTADSLYLASRTEIFIKQDHKLVRVETGDIRYVEALGDYVNIYTGPERHTVYTTMKELETKLPPRDFARVHRKYIVRVDRITAIETDSVVVNTGRASEGPEGLLTVPIGSSYKGTLLSRLNLV